MANRYCGTVQIGGRFTQKQLDTLNANTGESVYFEADGCDYFEDCSDEDFDALIKFCCDSRIALMIQWEAKYEYDGKVEYWIDGISKGTWRATQTGEIYVTLSDLLDDADKTVRQLIDSLGVPDFPEFELVT